MLFEIIIFSCLFMLVFRRWRIRKLMKTAKQFKSDIAALPFVGHSYLLIGSDERQMQGFSRLGRDSIKQGGACNFWHTNKLYILVSDPGLAEFSLKNCLGKDDIVQSAWFVTGNGSVFAPVPIWRPRRKILAPTFSPKNLENFMKIFNEQSIILTDVLKQQVGKADFSIWNSLTTFTMDSVCETTLGVKIKSQRNPNNLFLRSVDKLCHLIAKRMCQPWLQNDFVYYMTPYHQIGLKFKEIGLNYINEIIANKRKSITEKNETAKIDSNLIRDEFKSLLELLIESSGGDEGYTPLELQEETLVLLVAGTDTSAVGLSFIFLMLSKHPDVQEKAYQEILEVFGDSDRPVQTEDLSRLRYLDAVVKETLRLYPPVPLIARTVEKDVELPTGEILMEGCSIMVSLWAIHRNPKYWGDDAEMFRPERFIDTPLKHPAAFIPFSNGPRGCLGSHYAMMSMKTVLIALLRRYRVLPSAGLSAAKSTDAPLRVKFNIMMRHVDNYMVRLELRD